MTEPSPAKRGTLTPLDDLLRTLDLRQAARTREDIFEGQTQWMPYGRVFGGQVLAQSVIAASRTVADDRLIHSMHGYFLRPGDVEQTITLAVDRIHDGRSFSTRRAQAYQNGLPILSMIASFQDDDEGFEHFEPLIDEVPGPEGVQSDAELLGELESPAAKHFARSRPFELRHVNDAVYLGPAHDEPLSRQAVWMRATGPLPDDEIVHRAALAYASDLVLVETGLRTAGLSWVDPAMRAASLDHGMWWHRPVRADRWFLFVVNTVNATGGRSLMTGRVYDEARTLVATMSQEAMIRRKPTPSAVPRGSGIV